MRVDIVVDVHVQIYTRPVRVCAGTRSGLFGTGVCANGSRITPRMRPIECVCVCGTCLCCLERDRNVV